MTKEKVTRVLFSCYNSLEYAEYTHALKVMPLAWAAKKLARTSFFGFQFYMLL